MSTAIRIQVVRYQCPHCGTTRAKKAAAEAHIARCWHNPAARGCKTCLHFTPAETEGPYPEHPGFPEQCEAGRSLTGRLVNGCPLWESIAGTAPEDPR